MYIHREKEIPHIWRYETLFFVGMIAPIASAFSAQECVGVPVHTYVTWAWVFSTWPRCPFFVFLPTYVYM